MSSGVSVVLSHLIIYAAYILGIKRPSGPFSEWIKDCMEVGFCF